MAVVRLFEIGPHLTDDSYISFRYAHNLAHGAGLVFNPGIRVEGYSNFLWTVLLAIAARIGLDLPHTSIALGGLAFVTTVVVAVITAGRVGLGPVGAASVGLTVAILPVTAGSSLLGLETPLYALGISVALLAIVSDGAWARRALVVSVLVVGSARPEGLVLAVALGAIFAASRWHRDAPERRAALTATAAAVVLLVAWKVWARSFYGEWLPMSVIAKRDRDVGVLHSLTRSAGQGRDYAIEVLGRPWLLAALVLVVALAWCWRGINTRTRLLVASASVASAFGLAVALSNKGDWMPYGRLLAPSVPALVLLFGVGVAELSRTLRMRVPTGVAVAIGLGALVVCQPLRWHDASPIVDHSADDVGRAIAQAYRPGDVLVTGLLGRIGYYAIPVPFEDLYGLTDPGVAKANRPATVFGKFDPGHTASTRPTLIVDNSWHDVLAVEEQSSDSFDAVVASTLTDASVFIIVDTNDSHRYADALRPYFGDVHLTSIEDATATWRAAVPNDVSQGA